MIEFKIYSEYENNFIERLAQANRRAAKNGLAEFVATIARSRNDEGRLVSTITMDDNLPVLCGWSLVGMLDFVDGEMLTRLLPGRSLPAQVTNDPTRCDHCGVRHIRSHAVVVEHDYAGPVQVGKSCMADFLGKSAESLVSLEWLVEFAENFQVGGSPSGGAADIDLEHYLSYVQLAIRAYGWNSKTAAASNYLLSTADMTATLMCNHYEYIAAVNFAEANPHKVYYTISDALEWAAEQSGNDYLDNVASIARLEIVPRKYEGYAASILAAYERHLASEIERSLTEATAMPATNGRQVVVGTILSVKEKWGEYGMQIKMTVKTSDGWKLYCTLPKNIIKAGPGDTVELTVTVQKSDDDYFAFGSRPAKAKVTK